MKAHKTMAKKKASKKKASKKKASKKKASKKKSAKKVEALKSTASAATGDVEYVFADAWKRLLKERDDRKANSIIELRDIAPELFLENVATITAEYDAGGDSGNITDLKFLDVDGDVVTSSKVEALTDKISTILWRLLPEGFENNDGGWGELTVTLKDNKVNIEHNQRFTDSTYSEENIEF
jgi:uncharacterized FlaG/YvyC family protein